MPGTVSAGRALRDLGLVLKDDIHAHFKERERRRPRVDLDHPDVRLRVQPTTQGRDAGSSRSSGRPETYEV